MVVSAMTSFSYRPARMKISLLVWRPSVDESVAGLNWPKTGIQCERVGIACGIAKVGMGLRTTLPAECLLVGEANGWSSPRQPLGIGPASLCVDSDRTDKVLSLAPVLKKCLLVEEHPTATWGLC